MKQFPMCQKLVLAFGHHVEAIAVLICDQLSHVVELHFAPEQQDGSCSMENTRMRYSKLTWCSW